MDNIVSISKDGEMALTQKRIWQLQERYNCFFRSGLCIELKGYLDIKVFFFILKTIISKHEIFHTRFEQQLTSLAFPIQVIAPEKTNSSLIHTDVSDMSQAEQNLAIQKKWQARLAVRPNEAETLEVELLKLDEQSYTLLFTSPAIIADAYSLMNIACKVIEQYSAGNSDLISGADEFQFAQFTEWHNEFLLEAEAESKRFWDKRQKKCNLITIPLESNNQQQLESFEIIREFINLNNLKILEYCRAKDCSTEQFLFSVWAVLIWHYTEKQETLSLSKVFDGRSLEHFQTICGPFSKTLPLFIHIKDGETFDDVCKNVKHEMDLAGEWQDNFNWKYGNTDGEPLSNFSFEYMEIKQPVITNNCLFVRYNEIISDGDWFKLKLSCFGNDEQMISQIHANKSFITQDSLVCIANQFNHLVNRVLEGTSVSVSALVTSSSWEQKIVSEKFNATQREFNTTRSVVNYLEEVALNNPFSTVLKQGDTVIDWRSFNENANQWANYLTSEFSVGKGDVVAVSLKRSPLQIICLFAILKTGAGYLPIDHNIPEERMAFILENSEAKILISATEVRGEVFFKTRQVIVPKIKKILDQLSKKYRSVTRETEDTFYVMYTSGSTGKPKGVLVPDRSIINYAFWFKSEHNITRVDSSVLFSSIAFDLSYTALWPVLISGGTLHLALDSPVFDAENVLHILVQERISYIKLTPSHFNLLINSNLFEQLVHLLSLRLIVLGGEQIQVNDIEYYLRYKKDTSFLNHYGPTETTVGVISHVIDTENLASFRDRPLIGMPISNTEIHILDEHNQQMPIGSLGEICVAGKSVSKGYVNCENLNREKFIPNSYSQYDKLYKTGDMGRWTAGGQIEFCGRKDCQVKIHGYRIELEEIASVIQSFVGVINAFVTINNDRDGLIAFFTIGQPVSMILLKEFIHRKLPDYMWPRNLIQIKKFPLLANGKIDRTRLVNIPIMQSEKNDVALPETKLEKQLAKLWEKELGNTQFGIHDNFFDVGGNSFKLVGVFNEFSKTCPGKISLTDLFKYNTIHSLAGYVDSEKHSTGKDQTNFSFEV